MHTRFKQASQNTHKSILVFNHLQCIHALKDTKVYKASHTYCLYDIHTFKQDKCIQGFNHTKHTKVYKATIIHALKMHTQESKHTRKSMQSLQPHTVHFKTHPSHNNSRLQSHSETM